MADHRRGVLKALADRLGNSVLRDWIALFISGFPLSDIGHPANFVIGWNVSTNQTRCYYE